VQFNESNKGMNSIIERDRQRQTKLIELFHKYPRSEPGMIHFLANHLASSSVYLGNSLPIRHWDLASSPEKKPARIVGNRGANGIDGQVSTFLGWCLPEQENWAILGDLTAMYDLTAPWIISQIQAEKIKIVVVNNYGGQIFKRMFDKDIFINKHQIEFSSWARMWNLSYQKWSEVPKTLDGLQDRMILELTPDAEQTEKFWTDYDQMI
jgi:2-succinyl-5-enolpyruvyl-6-hydroxy-3-cyclohexene-1-carboxylate synthase